MKKFNFSYIIARPKHFQQDRVKIDDFKKIHEQINSLKSQTNPTNIVFFDEARFGILRIFEKLVFAFLVCSASSCVY
jgi:hypothetical protein